MKEVWDEYPHLDELTKEQKQWLLDRRVVAVKIEEQWTDDHLPCVGLKLKFDDGSYMDLSLWWLSDEGMTVLHRAQPWDGADGDRKALDRLNEWLRTDLKELDAELQQEEEQKEAVKAPISSFDLTAGNSISRSPVAMTPALVASALMG